MNLTNNFERNVKEKRVSVVVSLDIEKAFDAIWMNALIFNMIQLAFLTPLVLIIGFYLSNRKFKVVINSKDSSVYNIVEGVSEGSILGPLMTFRSLHSLR